MPRQQKISNDDLIREYTKKKKSTHNIAKEYKMHPETVRRRLIKLEVPLRSHSDAQKLYCDKNGSPVKGRKRTEGEKEAIARNITKYWDNMDEKDKSKKKKKIAKRAKKMWKGLTDAAKTNKLHNLNKKRLESTATGSKSELFLAKIFKDNGYRVEQKTHRYTAKGFEIDVCLPDEKIAIEVDGPTHFTPIYGEDRLDKVKAKDKVKNQTLMRYGFVVVRAQQAKNFTKAWCFLVADEVEKIIKKKTKSKVITLSFD